MSLSDPIADFLTRIRNAISANKRRVDSPSSKMKIAIAEILKQQKFILDYSVIEDNKQNILRVLLKYSGSGCAISGLKKISTPGLKRYSPADKLPRVLNGYGIAIISTSKGLKTDYEARASNLGGEVICYIW